MSHVTLALIPRFPTPSLPKAITDSNSLMKDMACIHVKSSSPTGHVQTVQGCSQARTLIQDCNRSLFHLILFNSALFSLSVISDSVTPWTAAHQASLSITNSWSLLKLMSIELVMPSNYLIFSSPLLLPSIFPSIKVFSSESVFSNTTVQKHQFINTQLSLQYNFHTHT